MLECDIKNRYYKEEVASTYERSRLIRTESSTAPTIRLFVPTGKMGRSNKRLSILGSTALLRVLLSHGPKR